MQYLASLAIHHYTVDKPHQSFLAVIHIASRQDKTYVIGLEETFRQHLMACERDSNGLHENINVTYLDKHFPEHSERLP